MYDLITLGTISIDLYYKSESFTHNTQRFNLALGGKYEADFFYESIGGGAINVAVGAKHLGLRTGVVSTIGNNDFKHFIKAQLTAHGISDIFCLYEDNYMNISTILLSPEGERTILHYHTGHQHDQLLKNYEQAIKRTKNVYFGSLSDHPFDERLHMLSQAAVAGATSYLNLNATDCRSETKSVVQLTQKSDVLILNGHELATLMKTHYSDINFHQNLKKYYFADKGPHLLVITDSAHGSYAYDANQIYYQASIPTQIVDATGAGDGYCAGFISSYSNYQDVLRAMEYGAQYATKILAKIGAN